MLAHSARIALGIALIPCRIGVVGMSSGGLSALTDIVAAFAYDLEAGRPDPPDK